jgi:hypothetical protein
MPLCRLEQSKLHQQHSVSWWWSFERESHEPNMTIHVRYDFEAATRVEFRFLYLFHIDRGYLYEPSGIKIIVLCSLEVEIINVHVFTRQPALVY